ncbi:hypothetical protein HanRHA438_Chr01g0029601 [Helianthus annuus]|uniref:Uncharacterized protein n=1 Tax=Helianthus annuus TaxID=4232 RepID=A0A9K3JWZ2_HELAN|nr:hypothetical protein HanXRQr2_Chr01g0029151 [Helianthus annuus]KAJ0612112.1 hypothetical protein HanHA300_Chr01g0023491 [Helianthus annuus]KAJ0627467.1 hypothetical protein HanHA89_Chr01g0025691 [Helianthus annuus]KAJ0948646.1 hypothetical protein HanRHA438_Chr01g0029601 [Helianthus annuus]
MSLRDALKVPNFSTLDFDFDDIAADEGPFLKQISSAAQEIRPPVAPKAFSVIPSGPEPQAEAVGSSGVQVGVDPPEVTEDSDPEIRDLDKELLYPSSVGIGKGKGTSSGSELKRVGSKEAES